MKQNKIRLRLWLPKDTEYRYLNDLEAWYMHGHLREEKDQQNISREGGGVMAVGQDTSRYLPGMYQLNF